MKNKNDNINYNMATAMIEELRDKNKTSLSRKNRQ